MMQLFNDIYRRPNIASFNGVRTHNRKKACRRNTLAVDL